jgi:hypothetical protein
VRLQLITAPNYAALVTAGLLSVMLFPLLATMMLVPKRISAAPSVAADAVN